MMLWNHFERLNQEVGEQYDKEDKNPNHNEIVSIYFGFKNFEKYGYLQNISQILYQVSKLEQMKEKDKNKKNIPKYDKKIQKLLEKSETEEKKYFEHNTLESKQEPRIAYVTFRSIEGQIRTLSQYNKGKCRMCCEKLCMTRAYSRTLLRGSRKIRVKQAISPELIKWENLGVSSTQRCFRVSIIWLISFILIGICFGLIVYLKNQQIELQAYSKPIECPKQEVTMEMALKDQ